ncbi:hypothetical protein ACFYQT_34605 [Streptomyces tibetensis]|uniref:Uncharacterized protein n=1 Tax=Streptomyces tibetensis TaxID=2382123 RepID=A0ABW6N5I6_9ACTN
MAQALTDHLGRRVSYEPRVDFVGTDLFTAGSGAFTAQRHIEDLLTLTSRLRPDRSGS